MFKQVFSKLFKNEKNQLAAAEQYNGQAQIYAIPTISSNFQQKGVESSSNRNQITPTQSTISFNKLDYYAKYDDNNTRQIYIAPHCIRYSNSTLDDTIYRIDDESLNEIAVEILESENMPPKLQIVYYDNNYFAINNSNLQIYKQLQLSGIITHVQADLISVEAIPFALREYLLQTPSHLLESYTNELVDSEYHEELNSNGSQCHHDDSNEMSTISGGNESLSDSIEHECNSHSDECRAPDVVFAEDVYDENNIYVDEIYEFGACENCLDSEDENGVNQNRAIERIKKDEILVTDLNKNEKLDVYLKQKNVNEPKIDLNEVMKNALKNEEENLKFSKNMNDEPLSLSNEFSLLNFNVNQKEMNEDLFKQSTLSNEFEKKKFIKKSFKEASKNTLKSGSDSTEIENLLVSNQEDDA